MKNYYNRTRPTLKAYATKRNREVQFDNFVQKWIWYWHYDGGSLSKSVRHLSGNR